MLKRTTIFLMLVASLALVLVACGVASSPAAPAAAPAEPTGAEADLAAVKAYALENAQKMKTATAAFRQTAESYYSRVDQVKQEYPGQNPYEYLATERREEMAELLAQAKEQWLEASTYYELDEGIVAGVPDLAFYDVWIDAGPPAADAPDEALAWQLVLVDGRVLDSPGNFFHNLTEPALYGTNDEFTALKTDLDGDGEVELGEVLPDAEVLLGAAQGLDQATGQMLAAIEAWQPSLEDTLGALVTMTPTMNEYFEQWKLSAFVLGENFEETSFVAVSRLFDINGILNGLNVAYTNISPVVAASSADLDRQISSGYAELAGYVADLYQQEQEGKIFSAEEADLYGTEAQDQATALAGQVAQAAALIEVELAEAEPVFPAEPIVITATAPQAAAQNEANTVPAGGSLTIYSGRSESLVDPLIEQFEQDTGIEVAVRYGDTAGMAATILEEGDNSPADLFYGQDAGALGALSKAGRLVKLPDDMLALVEPRFRSPEGTWIGTSGRARVVVYNPERTGEDKLPADIFGFCEPEWRGRVGWAPTNGSFQAFVTAMRVLEGEERTREWLTCMQANEPIFYANNASQVEAVASGEIDAGLVNHYYLYRYLAEDPSYPARNYTLPAGDAGAIVNIAGAGILDTAANPQAAEAFIRYMLSQAGQNYFNTETHEYPLSADIELNPLLTPLENIKTPELDLSDLDDLPGTLELLQELGIL